MSLTINLDDWNRFPTQEKVYSDDKHKIVIQSAGLGSGKTRSLCHKLLKLSAINKQLPGAILCPTFKDFRRDVKPEMFDVLENHFGLVEKKHFWFHKGYNEFSFIWNKSPLYVLSAETPIAGPNLAYCGVNEFSLIQWDRIREMLRRVRLKSANLLQRLMVGTPEDVYGWLEEFIENQEKENEKYPGTFKIYYGNTSENTEIDKDYIRHLESTLDTKALKVFTDGQIVRLSGEYYYYAFDRHKNVKPLKQRKNDLIYIGMDFNVGKMSASFANKILSDKPVFQFFDEILIEGNSDTHQLCKAILSRFPANQCMIRCDASGKSRKTSGASDVDILRQYFPRENIAYRNANPRHRLRQLMMNGLFEKEQILIDPSCKLLIKDFSKVQQNKVDFSKSKKNEDLTHFSDGADYLIDYELNFNLKRPSVQRY